ncbi:hypothetical protein [Geobacter sulfurreducens]|uniref:hypothetical protein n=1 Tax=Geobacter sulfurreducens TaxID=35554 RepID=UPI00117EE7DE|nr:hypothetical protein [Geobacter sulfurreducens]
MERHKIWRQQYRAHRYMEYLSDSEVKLRGHDIFVNFITINMEGLISPLALDSGGQYWIILWTHILEEYQLRGLPYDDFKKEFSTGLKIPDPTSPKVPKAIQAIQGKSIELGSFLFKFGEETHLKDILKYGRIRIAPASFYKDPSLNSAIQDNELEFTAHVHPSKVDFKVIDQSTGKPIDNITPSGNISFKTVSTTDFYVFCAAASYGPRLYLDFNADCCLVIKEPNKFADKVVSQLKLKHPDWKGAFSQVYYLDPLNYGPKDVNMFLSKHFRYAYQNEWRIIWHPRASVSKLEPIFIEVGNCEADCELLKLDES